MARKKKDKKTKKAAKKARKAEKKARKKAAQEAAQAASGARAQAGKATKAPARKATKAPARKATKAPARKATKAPARKAARRVARRKPSAPPRPARQQPGSLRLRSAAPSFTVNDIEQSLAFYRDVLRFAVKERWEEDGVLRGVELVAGRVTFWLSQDDWKKGRDRVKGQGVRIYCTTAEDVDALAEGFRARGGTLAEEPQDRSWGGRDFAVVDPDGFAITIASEG